MKLLLPTFIIIAVLIAVPLYRASGQSSLLESELKGETRASGFSIDVLVITNKETKLQDLYITPESDVVPSRDKFFYAVANAVSTVTEKSFAYKLYVGMVMIEIDEGLFAISADDCREIFKLQTIAQQHKKLDESFKKLR